MHVRHWRSTTWACVGLALALAACGPTRESSDFKAATPGPAGEPTVIQGPAAAQPGLAVQGAQYRISRQDTIEVAVYGVADLSRSLEVDGSGQINMPLLGGVMAAGRTVRELEADISRKLGARYLQKPQVSVFVKDAVGQRVTVDGAVRKPGVISAKGETTLLRALAEAQGFSDTADLSGILVFRQTDKGRQVARYDAAAIRSGQAADPPIYGGDTIIVDESAAKSAWKSVREIVPVAGVLRPF